MLSLRITTMAWHLPAHLACIERRPEVQLLEQKPLDERESIYALHVQCETLLAVLLLGVELGRELPLSNWKRNGTSRQKGGVPHE